jgi:prephenate dehydrogenase
MQVCVVGLGLIGGSVALSLKAAGFASYIIGVENSEAHAQKALALGLVDQVLPMAEAIAQAELILVAVPVDTTVILLPKILDLIDNQTVIDMGSTKKPMVDAVKLHPKRKNFVATHPMAGTEFSGPEAAVLHLFDDKYTVLCDIEDSDPTALAIAHAMYAALNMKVTYMAAAAHDVHTADISHVSHLCSFALAKTVLDKEKDESRIFELASSGFASTVRLAKSNPATWIPIFKQNQDNILEVLDQYISELNKIRGFMEAGRDFPDAYEALRKHLVHANDIQRILK